MLRTSVTLLFLILLSFRVSAEDLGVRVLVGLTDTASTRWDGSVSALNAERRRLAHMDGVFA